VGGLLFGGAVFAYRRGYVGNPNPTVALPEDMTSGILRSTPFEIYSGPEEEPRTARSEYHLQKTRFRVWNILNKKEPPHVVFFVTPTQYVIDENGAENTRRIDPFYAMLGIPRYFKKGDLLGHIRKDSQVVFYICLAGGGPTGIPTGDKLLSRGKLASWEFFADGDHTEETQKTEPAVAD
jgi:hypothetical protein